MSGVVPLKGVVTSVRTRMRRNVPLFTLLAAAVLVTASVRGAEAPPHVLDLGKYMRRLERSQDPKVMAIRRQIENGPADLERERTRARREGIPLNPADLGLIAPPDHENAAPLYERLAKLRSEKPLDPEAQWVLSNMSSQFMFPPEVLERARREVKARADVFGLLHEAADRPRHYRERKWTWQELGDFPRFAIRREAARLIRAESNLLARERRYREAIANQRRGFRVAAHVAAEPSLLGYLAAVAIDAHAVAGMEDILQLAGPNAAVSKDVRAAIEAGAPLLDPRAALKWEGVELVIMMDLQRQLPREHGLEALSEVLDDLEALVGGPKALTPARPLTPAELRFSDRLWDAIEADSLRRLRATFAELEKPYWQQHPLPETPEDESYLIAGRGAPLAATLNGMGLIQAQTVTRQRVMVSAAAILAYHEEYGSFPKQRAQALPRLSNDPFTGRPLGYRAEKKGFVVYSAGRSGKFSGGKPGGRYSGEVLFRYPIPPVAPPARPE